MGSIWKEGGAGAANYAQFCGDEPAKFGFEETLGIEESSISIVAETGLGLGLTICCDVNASGSFFKVDKSFHGMRLKPFFGTKSGKEGELLWLLGGRACWAAVLWHSFGHGSVLLGDGRAEMGCWDQ
ncbi:unnamed protein product [Cylindrotheca closterium]|uniref:Uncharacterized protein n=1 Tax=Cylindrotheca closterium TaxID=2856 RepID=A0AAD2CFB0_9STRA|nr:unnamed protein product [Cylindrotheca closterium]